MTHALASTTTATPSATVRSLHAAPEVAPASGLSALDAFRVDAAIAAGRADSTRKTYASAWRRFDRWCADRALTPLPATPATTCAYLADFAEQGVASATIEGACAAIADAHLTAGHANPVAEEIVRQVRRGIRRMLGTAPRRQAYPLTPDDIRQMLAHADRATVKGTRDAALILLGFASALRRSELAALTMADLEPKPAGLLVHVRRSKGDPEAHGQIVGVARGRRAATDPIAALDAWLTLRGTVPGALFTNVHHGRVGTRTITGSGLTNMLKDRAAAAGIPADRVTGHSLRAGHATTAAIAGVDLARIAAQTRHRRISTLVEHYIRPLEALQVTSSRDLGL